MKPTRIALAVLLSTTFAYAEDSKEHDKDAAPKSVALAAAMKDAKVTLGSALKASEKEGAALSAKFELEDGKLQLSVYTMKGDKFFEVVVDHKTGKISKTEPITSGDDLAAAKKQAEAMGKTKATLRDVVARVEKANAGFKAVGVTPELENGVAMADLVLLKGTESKQVEEKL